MVCRSADWSQCWGSWSAKGGDQPWTLWSAHRWPSLTHIWLSKHLTQFFLLKLSWFEFKLNPNNEVSQRIQTHSMVWWSSTASHLKQGDPTSLFLYFESSPFSECEFQCFLQGSKEKVAVLCFQGKLSPFCCTFCKDMSAEFWYILSPYRFWTHTESGLTQSH